MNGKISSNDTKVNVKRYCENYDAIDWHREPKNSSKDKKEEKKSPSK